MTNTEAITKLTNIMHDDHYAWHPSILTAFSMAVDALSDLPSAQPEQRWVPVTERLPKEKINPNTQDYDWVLCSTTFGDVRAYHFGRGRFLHGCGDVTQYVTAWCELPEPYKEDPCNGCVYLGESCVGEGCWKLTERKEGADG